MSIISNKKDDFPILLVEDDVVDVKTIKRAFKCNNFQNSILHAENGQAAIDLLENIEDSNSEELPSLIILDINMPVMNGIEFLELIKQNDKFKSIPVVVLTTSNESSDRKKIFSLSAAGYMIKELDFERFTDKMKALKEYWSQNEIA